MAREERNEIKDSYTIEDNISNGSTSVINYYNTSILQKIGDIEYASDNIINDYLEELIDNSTTVELSDLEFIKYIFRPDLLSYDVYGTMDFDFVILAINGICDPKDFDRKKIKLPSSDILDVLLNYIYNAENDYILKNRANYEESTF